MNTIRESLVKISTSYSPAAKIVAGNMRLLLLVIFSVMCGFLVFRVDSIITNEPNTSTEQTSITSKRPNKEVLTVLNEIYEIETNSETQFTMGRDNPF